MLKKFTKKNEGGFTLIELMIVIAIIGILAAIAIPQFSHYRIQSYNSSANADLRNAVTAQEAYFIDKKIYSAQIADLVGTPYALYTSQNSNVSIVASSAAGYTMKAYHTSGDKTWSIHGPGGSITGF